MRRLMVMGAAIEQIPGIRKAKEMGYEVGVIDFNPNAAGISLADKYFNVSTIDAEGVLRAAREFGADGFLTLATDLPIRAVAFASEHMGLRGVSQHTALLATDKGEMMKALKAYGVESPWYFIIDTIEELKDITRSVEFPCIIKPTDNAASRGVTIVHDIEELIASYNYSKEQSHSGSVIVEEYMVGPEVSVEVLTYDGIPYVLQITDKITSGAPHFVEVGHNQPSRLSGEIQECIKDVACKAVKALGIQTGPAHVEIIVTERGPKIVELGARLGGDCITSHLVYLSTGIDMLRETITVLCGGEPELTPMYNKGAAIRFLICEKQGVLDYVDGKDEASAMQGVIEVSDIMKPGDLIESIRSSDDRVAFVISQADSAEEAEKIADQALVSLKVILK